MNSVDNKLATWISSELETRGWSARELGRRSGYTGAYISRIISGEQSGSFDFVAKIAPVFGKTPEDGFRQAGLLSPQPGSIQEEQKLLSVFRHLAPAHQKLLVEMLYGLPGAAPAVIRESAGQYQSPAIPPLPGDEDIMELLKRLDPYHQRTVYDFARWTLEQQDNPYDSDLNRREKERQYNIGVAELIEAVHALPVDKLPHVLNYLLALKENHLHSE